MRKLPGQPVNRIGMCIGGLVMAGLLIWLNFFPQYFGYVRGVDRPLVITPVLLPEFNRYLVRINILWVSTILLNLAYVVTGRVKLLTFLAGVLVDIYSVSLLVRMAVGPTFIAPEWFGLLVRLALGLAALGVTAALILRVLAFARSDKQASVAAGDPAQPA